MIPAIYQLKRLNKVKKFISILLIDNKIFLDSPFGTTEVVIGIPAIENSVLAAKDYLYCIARDLRISLCCLLTLLLSCHSEKRRNQPNTYGQGFYLWASALRQFFGFFQNSAFRN